MDEVTWIKVVTDIFDNPKIKQIENMPSGPSLVLLWLKLLCLCGARNCGGRMMLTDKMPYDADMLSVEFRQPLRMVKYGLDVFESFGMIERVDGVIEIPSWDKYQSGDKLAQIREYNRLAKQRSRERRRLLQAAPQNVNDMSRTVNDTSFDSHVTVNAEEEELDKEYQSITLTAHAGAVQEEKTGFFGESGEKNSESAARGGGDVTKCSQRGEEQKRRLQQIYLGGTLGQGLVMMNMEQFDTLCEQLSFDEIEKYLKIVVDCEKSGKKYRKKTHYQAILDMVAEDRRV